MFCLGHKVCRNELGIGSFIRKNQYFTWSGNHIYIYNAKKQFFCGCNINISGADYFINFWNFLRSKSKRGNSLCPAG